ncbi:MAG: hypothetical protein RL571_3500 [Pseudomonadota bacterium]|jgi:hypothetical protein
MTKKTSATRIAVLITSLMLSFSLLAWDNWQEGIIYTSGVEVTYLDQRLQALMTHTAYVGENMAYRSSGQY